VPDLRYSWLAWRASTRAEKGTLVGQPGYLDSQAKRVALEQVGLRDIICVFGL